MHDATPAPTPVLPPPPVICVSGERVALGPWDRAHLPSYTRWMNDFSITANLDPYARPRTAEELTATLDHVLHTPEQIWFAVIERSSQRCIGYTGLTDIAWPHRTAEFAITIGEADCRGRGYGTETTRLVCDYGFSTLGLSNILLRVYAYNAAAIGAYTRAGFREFGRRRASRLHQGQQWDTVYMEQVAPATPPATLATAAPVTAPTQTAASGQTPVPDAAASAQLMGTSYGVHGFVMRNPEDENVSR